MHFPAISFAGLLHGLGKYTSAFQKRLTGSNEFVDHSTAGKGPAFSKPRAQGTRQGREIIP